MNSLFENPFTGYSKEWLIKVKAHYERLIAEQDNSYVPPINVRTGKPMTVDKMEWMLPAWKKGLKMINQILEK